MFTTIWGHGSYFFKEFSLYLFLIVFAFWFSFFLLKKVYKAAISERRKRVFLLLIFSFLSLVLIYSFFEGYFRFRFDQSDSLGVLKVTARWMERHVVYNDYQYRDRDFVTEKKPGVVRIGVMGDSNTFGYGIKDVHKRFSDQLEAKLNNNGYHVEIYNFGVSGVDTDGEIIEYNRLKHLNFDLLVWQYFLNDVEQANNSAGQKVVLAARQKPPGVISFLSDQSYFFDYLYWRFAARYQKTFFDIRNADLAQYNDPAVFGSHKQTIDEFTQSLSSENKKFVVMILPFLYFFPNYPNAAIEVHNRMGKIFTEDGAVSVIDMLPVLKGQKRENLIVSPYDSHPNEYVHKIMADKLYDAIVPLLEKTDDGKTIVKE